MAKGDSVFADVGLGCLEVDGEHRRAVADADAAGRRVQKIQTKLHQWAIDEPDRRFDDLCNLVYDPASSRRPGTGCGAIEGHARRVWMA